MVYDDSQDLPDEEYDVEGGEELIQLEPCQYNEAKALENPSLRSFTNLKYVGLGVRFLYLYTRGISDKSDHNSEHFLMADNLPPNLESLRIHGYQKGSPVKYWDVVNWIRWTRIEDD